MGHTRATDTTKEYLENAALPQHGKPYTVVSHKSVAMTNAVAPPRRRAADDDLVPLTTSL